MERDERRRLTTYKLLSKVENLEETLRALSEWSRTQAIQYLNANVPTSAHYWTGRADALDDLMSRVRLSTKRRYAAPEGKKQESDQL